MNSLQRRKIARRYFQITSEELNGKLWDTDMDLHEESSWAFCRFLSRRFQCVYILSIHTAAQVYHDKIFDRAYDDVIAQSCTEIDQAVEIMAKVKVRMQEIVESEPAPLIHVELREDRGPKHRIGRKVLFAVVREQVITEEVITNVVSNFLDTYEEPYCKVLPIEFDKQTMIQYLDPFNLTRESDNQHESSNNGCKCPKEQSC